MIKTSDTGDNQRHLVLNKQKVSTDLADYATPEVYPVEMVDIDDVEILTGMKPGSINFLIEEKYYHQSFIVSLFQPDIIQMRPGETEYLGAKAEHNLDTAIIEVPLGKVGMNYKATSSLYSLRNLSETFWPSKGRYYTRWSILSYMKNWIPKKNFESSSISFIANSPKQSLRKISLHLTLISSSRGSVRICSIRDLLTNSSSTYSYKTKRGAKT
jgi:hypothetical protein